MSFFTDVPYVYPPRKSIILWWRHDKQQHVNVWSHTWEIWGTRRSSRGPPSVLEGIPFELMLLWILINIFEICSFVPPRRQKHLMRANIVGRSDERREKNMNSSIKKDIKQSLRVFPPANEGFFQFLSPSSLSFFSAPCPASPPVVNYVKNPQ